MKIPYNLVRAMTDTPGIIAALRRTASHLNRPEIAIIADDAERGQLTPTDPIGRAVARVLTRHGKARTPWVIDLIEALVDLVAEYPAFDPTSTVPPSARHDVLQAQQASVRLIAQWVGA